MALKKLAHFSVRTTELELSKKFYTEILGFQVGFRPAFPFPGIWLYQGGDEAEFGVVHLIGIDKNDPEGLKAYLGDKDESSLHGSAAVDHIAFIASDLSDMHRRLKDSNVPYRERTVPGLGLHQLFIEDPSGITIELNYPADEVKPPVSNDQTNESV
jgi:catechol 2,3-dioxygenase-like lactoylglutathione lyase family enzyme